MFGTVKKRKKSLAARVRALAAKVAKKERIASLKAQEQKLREKLQKL
jgi:hypothetical protein